MRTSLIRLASLLCLSFVFSAPPGHAANTRFSGTLEILASVGLSPDSIQLLSIPVSGTADISGSVVRIGAGEISATIAPVSDFGGTLVNGAATFSVGGAGQGSTCPAAAWQEVCIQGGGFGGAMQLSGVTHLGQELAVWGLSGTSSGMTPSGLVRSEQARLWTEGRASAWFYIPEIDATPFTVAGTGTFRGLSASALGDPGFSLVAPMIVTAAQGPSLFNVRAIARLRIDFSPQPVPLRGAGLVAATLALTGLEYLRRRSKQQRETTCLP